MFKMLEKYSTDLEEIVRVRTIALEEERKKTENLLSQMLPALVVFFRNIFVVVAIFRYMECGGVIISTISILIAFILVLHVLIGFIFLNQFSLRYVFLYHFVCFYHVF